MKIKNKKDLVDTYVNFIIDSMSHKLIEETLYDYILKEYTKKSKKEIILEIRGLYGDEWFEEYCYSLENGRNV